MMFKKIKKFYKQHKHGLLVFDIHFKTNQYFILEDNTFFYKKFGFDVIEKQIKGAVIEKDILKLKK